MRWSTSAAVSLVTTTVAVSFLSMPAAVGEVLPVGTPAPVLEVAHTAPTSTADGAKTTAVAVSTCRRSMTCAPIRVALTYAVVDADGITRNYVVETFVDSYGGSTELEFPAAGELIGIDAEQRWCEIPALGGCGTSRATSTELPVSTPGAPS